MASLRGLLLDHQPEPVPTLAAPGLSPHGRMRAIDFQVESAGRIVAGTESEAIAPEWIVAGWKARLQDAIADSNAGFRGPLASLTSPGITISALNQGRVTRAMALPAVPPPARRPGAAFEADCRLCPRLARFLDERPPPHPDYHCRPVAPFGSPAPRLLVVGLAPGLHGANRTGRPFTGDHAGILLYRTLHAQGSPRAPSRSRAMTACASSTAASRNAVKCLPPGNKPLPDEMRRCNRYLAARDRRARRRARWSSRSVRSRTGPCCGPRRCSPAGIDSRTAPSTPVRRAACSSIPTIAAGSTRTPAA